MIAISTGIDVSLPEEGDGSVGGVVVCLLCAHAEVLMLHLPDQFEVGAALASLSAPAPGGGDARALGVDAFVVPPALQLVGNLNVGVDEDLASGESHSVVICRVE